MCLFNKILESHIELKKFCQIVDLTEEEVVGIYNSKNKKEIEELEFQYIKRLGDRDLIPDLISFYREFFDNGHKLVQFVLGSLENDVSRRMINMLYRHVSLSDDIRKLRRGSDMLILFNLIVAIEALYSIAGSDLYKIDIMIDFFNTYVLDKEFIEKNFRLSFGDDLFESHIIDQKISIEEFARCMYKLRCDYVHEGNYWNFSFNPSKDSWFMNDLRVKLPRLSPDVEDRCVETRICIMDIRKIIVSGLINYIKHINMT